MDSPSIDRTLTELDHVRLKRLVLRNRQGRARADAARELDELDDLLDDASLVPATEIASDVVTMYSRVELRDLATGRTSVLTVCYPPDADVERGHVSALSPVGWSLLGRRIGEHVSWTPPTGAPVTVEIVAIPFQPEANGDYTT